MAAPNTATAAPDDDTPWDLTQTDAPGAAPPSPPPSAAPSSSAADTPIDYSAIARQLMQQPTLPQPDTTPVKRGWLSLLGEAIAGGPETDVMSPAQRERAGLRALGDFGTSLMAGSGYYPGKPMFGGLAEGFQGAQRSERGSEQQSAAYLGAQQQYQLEQQQAYLARLKEALPYLTLDQQSRQAAAARALAGGGGPAVPGTATGAGGGNYESAIGGIEGTGKNPNSSSSGVGGFLDSTWQDFASANPDLFKGMSPAQVDGREVRSWPRRQGDYLAGAAQRGRAERQRRYPVGSVARHRALCRAGAGGEDHGGAGQCAGQRLCRPAGGAGQSRAARRMQPGR